MALSPEQQVDLERLVARALSMPEEERESCVRSAPVDPLVRAAALLRLSDTADTHESPASSGALFAAGPSRPTEPAMPERIGEYRIRQRLASGGMGVVYLAQQDHPRRTVAVKVMKSGIASRSALRRFEYEAQMLARLSHPNIARIHGAGTHDDGADGMPYFVMEYIPGARPLTEHARERKLSTHERVKLFAKVCDAVYHGHQKGIIHRDLKPGNILVDSTGEPKVIDFGVARATDSDLAITTLQTDIGQLIGTVQYMSPEQCAADPHDIDIRSDVYSLGVVLYELLCDRTPYDISRKALHEAVRVVQHESPPRPSTFDRRLRGDLETIALKALAKERDRRYASALEFAQDLRRHLASEPIQARPASLPYHLATFVRRHRALVAAVVFAFVLLVAATAVSATFAVQAMRARNELQIENRQRTRAEQAAQARADDATTAKIEAERKREEAVEEKEVADQVIAFLIDDLLGAADPGRSREVMFDIREILDARRNQIEETLLNSRPAVEVRLRDAIGATYRAVGRFDDARHHLERAIEILDSGVVGPMPLVRANVMESYAWTDFSDATSFERSRASAREAFELRRTHLGETHPLTLRIASDLAYFTRENGVVAPSGLNRLMLGILATAGGKGMSTESVEATLVATRSEAERLWSRGDREGARAVVRKVATPFRQIPTLGDRATVAMAGYAGIIAARWPGATRAILEVAIEFGEEDLQAGHPDLVGAHWQLSQILLNAGELDEAESHCRRAIEIGRAALGENHSAVVGPYNILAWVQRTRGDYAEAEATFREMLRLAQALQKGENNDTVFARVHLAGTLAFEGRCAEADELYGEALGILDGFPPRDGRLHLRAHIRHGRISLYIAERRWDDAVAEIQRLVIDFQEAGQSPPAELFARLAAVYERSGRPALAEGARSQAASATGNFHFPSNVVIDF